jgi:hypothetical protein
MRQLANQPSYGQSPHPVIVAAVESGFGGICHRYEITGFALDTNPFNPNDATTVEDCCGKTTILFQQGPVSQDGVPNGVTIQSLLAVIGDHLQGTPDNDESGLGLMSGVLENLRNAVGILNTRDERHLAQATANTAQTRVPALN